MPPKKWVVVFLVLSYLTSVQLWQNQQWHPMLTRSRYTAPNLLVSPPLRSNLVIPEKKQFSHRNMAQYGSVARHNMRNTFRPMPQVGKFLSSKPIQVKSDEPGAYSWGYRWMDEQGTQMFREETADGRGNVWGRYSFREGNGIMRIVEYVSDHNGFRTRIRSNEPGIVSSNPANAEIIRFENESELE